MIERAIARHGHPVLHDGQPVGVVTSGTQTPFLKKAIGMAYVPPALTAPGTELEIDIRGRRAKARRGADAVLQASRRKYRDSGSTSRLTDPRTDDTYPADLKYTKDHEWIRVDGDTGDGRHHRLRAAAAGRRGLRRAAGRRRDGDAGQSFGTIESVKAVSELFAPVTGEVIEVNTVAQGSTRKTSTASRTTRG